MDFLLLIAAFISVFLASIYIYLSWNLNYWTKRNVKGPRPALIFGNVPSLVKKHRHMALDMQEIYEVYKKSGQRFIGIFMTRNPQILVIDRRTVREIMVSNFKAFRANESSLWINAKVEKLSKRNPFFCLTEDWREQRTDVVGGLSANRLKQAVPIIFGACNKMTDFIKNEIAKSNNVIEIKAVCYNYTIEVIADFVWGINAGAFQSDKTANLMVKISRHMLHHSFQRTAFYYAAGLAPILRTLSTMKFFPTECEDFFLKIQGDALEFRKRNRTDRPDYLNYLLQLAEKKKLSLKAMTGHSLTVLIDGFETSGSVLYHVLYYLSGNQTVQEKLRQEIMANLDEKNEIGFDALMELPYLDQCFNETIRLISPIPVFSRRCCEETYLENSDNSRVKIEREMILQIPIYAMHHDAEVFPEPQKYIPERFNDGRAKELIQQGSFLPFGDGPRICAGMRLGQLEVKAGVFEIIRHFKITQKIDKSKEENFDPGAFIIGLSGDLLIEFELIK